MTRWALGTALQPFQNDATTGARLHIKLQEEEHHSSPEICGESGVLPPFVSKVRC